MYLGNHFSARGGNRLSDSFSPKGERITAAGIRHSDCGKCGAYSVNPAQLRHNKTVARVARKAIIKEANRTTG